MKVALVTGAYKGLGFEWCKQLAMQGFTVYLTARDFEKAKHAAEQLRALQLNVIPLALDVSNEEQLTGIAKEVERAVGHIDLIINNAGVNPKDYADKTRMAKAFYLKDLDANELLEVIRANSIAPLLVVKHFRHLLKKSERPCVINISSWLGSVTKLSFGGHYGYVGSKNLLNVFNKSMANELKEENIICVNVNPGWVQTDMGGQKAQLTTEQSVQSILAQVYTKITLEQSGQFLNYDGTIHPW